MLSLISKHDEARDCVEDCFFSILGYFNRKCEILYLNSWHFDYNPAENLSIGERIVLGNKNISPLISKYLGIRVNKIQFKTYDDFFKKIEDELNHGRPVFIYVNVYYLPWLDNFYHTIKHLHACIITGIDKSKEIVNCIDPFFVEKNVEITFKDFKESWECVHVDIENTDRIELYQFLHQREAEESLTWREILNELLTFKKTMKYQQSPTGALQLFANEIITLLPVEKESTTLRQGDPLIIWKMWNASMNCSKVLRFLEYLELLNTGLQFPNSKKDLEEGAHLWNIVRGLINKYLIAGRSNLLDRISQRLQEIAILEEKITDDLDYAIRNGSEKGRSDVDNDKVKMQPGSKNLKYFILDLSPVMNSKGIGPGSDTKADFDGGGFFYLKEIFPGEISLDIYHCLTHFSIFVDKATDNISCMDQVIPIFKDRIAAICFLGASENGCYKDYGLVKYADGDEEKKTLAFTDWFQAPIFNEKVVLEGPAYDLNNRNYPKVRLFLQTIDINPQRRVNEFILPYCPNIHIFAITLLLLQE